MKTNNFNTIKRFLLDKRNEEKHLPALKNLVQSYINMFGEDSKLSKRLLFIYTDQKFRIQLGMED